MKSERILLVKPSEGNDISFHPPIGLWSIRSNAPWPREIRVLDVHLEGESALPTNERFDVIGFSVQFGTQEPSFRRMLPWAQAHTDRILVGGPFGSTLWSSEFLTFKGDGETVFGGKRFPEGNYAMFNRDELEPYWELNKPHNSKSKTNRWLPVETSRGCARHCGFCYSPSYWGPWRPRSIEQLRDFFSYVQHRDVEELIVEDDAVNTSKERFLQIIDALKARKLFWSLPNGMVCRNLDEQVMRALENSRLWRIHLPFETGSRKTADLMSLGNKWLEQSEAFNLTKWFNAMGTETCGSFVIGWPGETEDDVKRTFDFIESLPLKDTHLHIAQPYAGTPLRAYVEEKGWLKREPDAWVIPSIETPWLSASRLVELRSEFNAHMASMGR